MTVERTIKFNFSEKDRNIFEAAKEFLDNIRDDDYEEMCNQLCTIRELYDSLDDFINFMNDNME